MGFNTSVLMSDADHFSTDQAINPYYGETAPHLEKARAEHAELVTLYKKAGITVHQVASPSDSQDGVYTANWALVRGKKAVLAHLPDARKTEGSYAESALQSMGFTVIRTPDGLRFSGQGDALPFGNFLFCGKGYRSDEAAQEFAAHQLGYTRVQLQTIPQRDEQGAPITNPVSGWPDSFFYDIDLALSIIRPPEAGQKGIIAYCPDAFTPESQEILRNFDADTIIITLEEATKAFAANLVSTGKTVIMSPNAPKLKAELESRGLTVLSPVITELIKGGGYIRCTSLSFND